MNESDFLSWIAERSDFDAKKVLLGPGDDMAVLSYDRSKLLVAVDQVLDGVHFNLAEDGPRAAGRKALARNLSDIAAMAALPVAAVASVALPRNADQAMAEEIYHGLRNLGDQFFCPIVGGDVSVWDNPLAISVTVLGKPGGVTGKIKPVTRSGAKPGNAICITGPVGRSWKTDHHLTFIPRLQQAAILSMRYPLKAMIDISDGLAKDLSRICKASGVGADLKAEKIPLRENATMEEGLFDGEDYELLFAVPNAVVKRIEADDKLLCNVRVIGRFSKTPGMRLIEADGQSRELPADGWEHRTEN